MTEGDVICIFSQYGEILHINLVRDQKTGKSKGFAFLRYADQRSTVLAVDNLNGSEVLGRKLRVDHVAQYKQPRKKDDNEEDWEQDPRASMNVAPVAQVNNTTETKETMQVDFSAGLDPEDPMYEYLLQERKQAASMKQVKTTQDETSRERRARRHRSRSPRRRHRHHSPRRDKERHEHRR